MKTTYSEELKMLDGMARDFAARELVEEREEHEAGEDDTGQRSRQ